jgi:hypothetical protein
MVMYGWVGTSGAVFSLTSPTLGELEVKVMACGPGRASIEPFWLSVLTCNQT